MKRLAVLLLIAVVLVGCGTETEKPGMKVEGAKQAARTLTLAWHKITEDDGTVCDFSTSTQAQVELAAEELRSALAPHGVDVVVETLAPAKAEGEQCICNRVLIQGRYVEEWLGAEFVGTPCSGCPNQAECTESSDGTCGGQTALVYHGGTYNIVPANLIVMAGLTAAADLTGETISYNSCQGTCTGTADCTCGRCEAGCRLGTGNLGATGCAGDGVEATEAAQPKPSCSNAAVCTGKECPLAGH